MCQDSSCCFFSGNYSFFSAFPETIENIELLVEFPDEVDR